MRDFKKEAMGKNQTDYSAFSGQIAMLTDSRVEFIEYKSVDCFVSRAGFAS